MRARLVAGNWKMHGNLAANQALLEQLRAGLARDEGVICAVCPPFPYLSQAATVLGDSPIRRGAQNLSEHESGAHTGEVSGAMLRDLGCRYVIVGHSERRTLYGEDDDLVAAKFEAAGRAALTPILCVGETLAERDAGQTESVLARQLQAVLRRAGVKAFAGAVLAYEPVWAIGTGKTATREQAQAAHAFLRGIVRKHDDALGAGLTILYGGSVKPANAGELFAMPDVDGGLIGGASLVGSDFIAICKAARPKAA
jgi:triosephosphate isomerase (TIM)